MSNYYTSYVIHQHEILTPHDTFTDAEEDYFNSLEHGCCHVLVNIPDRIIYYNINIYPDSFNPLVIHAIRHHGLKLKDFKFYQKDTVYEGQLDEKEIAGMIKYCEEIYEKMTKGLPQYLLFKPASRHTDKMANQWLKDNKVPYRIEKIDFDDTKLCISYDCGLVVDLKYY